MLLYKRNYRYFSTSTCYSMYTNVYWWFVSNLWWRQYSAWPIVRY